MVSVDNNEPTIKSQARISVCLLMLIFVLLFMHLLLCGKARSVNKRTFACESVSLIKEPPQKSINILMGHQKIVKGNCNDFKSTRLRV